MGLPDKKKVVVISTLFPNQEEPERGLYTFQIVQELGKLCCLQVIAPVPWFPGLKVLKIFKRWHRVSQVPRFETYAGISVFYPRYVIVPKISGPLLSLSIFLAIFSMLKEMKKKGQVEAINAHWVYPEGVGATLAARILNIPIVLSALGSDINLYNRFLLRKLQIRWALNRAQSVTAVIDSLKEEIIRLGISPLKVKTIPNGVDENRFFIRARGWARDSLGLEKDFKLILFVGSFDRFSGTTHTIKGSEYLIEAISILRKGYVQGFKLVLIGEGELRRSIQRRAQELGVLDIASFLGKRPYEEIPLWMNACDVFVRPSLIDGMPNVVLEALACGRPVVASRVGGLPQMVNFKNGILVESGDPESIASGLKRALMKNWNEEEIFSSVEELTWEKCAQRYFEQIKKAMGMAI